MNIPFSNYRSHMITAAVFSLLGMFVGYRMVPQPVVAVEQHAPAIELPSGGYVAERLPDEPVSKPIKQATKELGGKLVRAGKVTVKPRSQNENDCPQVEIDWGLVKKDDGHRMTFYTDDGTIIGATDIPVKSIEVTKYPKWTVGAIAPVNNLSGSGPFIQRHFGRLTVGAAAVKMKDTGWQGMASIAINW